MPDQTLKFVLDGLLTFCFAEDGEYGQIGINTAVNHEFKIVFNHVTHVDGERSLVPFLTVRISQHHLRQLAPFWLYVDSGSGLKRSPYSVKTRVFDGPPDVKNHPDDFRHGVDFEGGHFYDRKLDAKPGARLPSIFVAKGEFYTDTLTDDEFVRVDESAIPIQESITAESQEALFNRLTSSSGEKPCLLGRLAEKVGLNVPMTSRATLVFQSEELGSRLFEFTPEAGKEYEIHILNEAPEGGGSSAPLHPHHDGGSLAEHHHFLHHYDVFALNSGEKRFGVVAIRKKGLQVECIASPPCDRIILSRTHLLPT